MVFPKMRIWLHEPIEREQTVLNMATMIIIVRVAFFLDRCMWLIKNATATSKRETVEVRAATVRSKKTMQTITQIPAFD